MGSSRIEDIPSYRKLRRDLEGFRALGCLFTPLRPLLRLLGITLDEMEAAFAQLGTLEAGARELMTLPDRFNAQFANRGWIMYELMNVDVAKAAVFKAEGGDVDGAEQDLVDYYDEQRVRMGLVFMQGIAAFRPRLGLAHKALRDYSEGRYYACVPVTLALLDGLVNELGPRGFFAEGVDLQAWDSVAAHSSGLTQLAKLLGAMRTKTTTEPLTIPYRNGILHGMDLGFDNKLVATKAWAALFATRDWALRVQQGTIAEQPEPPPKGWRELMGQVKENAEDKERLEAWTPRNVEVGIDVPATGDPEAYAEGSPERAVVEFLALWRARNYGHMTQYLPHSLFSSEQSPNKAAGQLREHYRENLLKSFELVKLQDDASAVTRVTVKLASSHRGVRREEVTDCRLVYEDASGNPFVRGKPGGAWKIYSYLV